jgi:hypothetical protein
MISAYMSSGILAAKLIATPMIFFAWSDGRLRRIWFGLEVISGIRVECGEV